LIDQTPDCFPLRTICHATVRTNFTSHEILETSSDVATDILSPHSISLSQAERLSYVVPTHGFGIRTDHEKSFSQ
jgi:hypothetical protein